MKTVMQWLREKFPEEFKTVRKDPPIIMTQWGPTTETYRLQAAMNMKADPKRKAAVESLLTRQLGSVEKGMAESRRRFPEAYED